VDSAAKKKHALGVLFIHGIGEQQRGDTLLRCAEPLADWLQKWSEGAEVPAPPSPTDTHLGPAHDEPAHTTLRGPNGDRAVGLERRQARWQATDEPILQCH
jgi:hypothetical protein